jgi:integrase/recombinase XerC
MSAAAARKLPSRKRARVIPERWVAINTAAPQLAETMLAYLDQITVSQRPNTVHAVEIDLRLFAGFLIGHDPGLAGAVDIERSHVEAFKVWQHAQPGTKGTIKASTFRRRIGMLRMFFIRIIEWDWPDAPSRVPIFFGDVPKRDEPLPRFLDDADYVKFMRALGEESRIHRRLAIELLARTGMRVGELCDLEADAVTLIGDAYWLRIPVGKLHNDRCFESICENCTHFATNKTFQPVLIRQRDHATRNGQTGRAHLFTTLIEKVSNENT